MKSIVLIFTPHRVGFSALKEESNLIHCSLYALYYILKLYITSC